ncbi:hypothetical protein BBK82_30660 [Lentzea guizhouensis]|uniref:Phosphoglycerate mutase n=1 Tax=Lentzea guizhouensis TaxID=1586287 RepID=A0A1B2HPV9_9PSEU|nr:histidine phosphatase family protein [Lentzea guizhouensis]ANZ39757.1 hypothetical protein BBK82_30660 [Lentzea guizhouensis]
MDVILVRHGHDVRCSPLRPLSATGSMQARAAALWLAEQEPTELWSGTLARAAGTAAVISQVAGLPVRGDARLNEIVNDAAAVLPPPRERAVWQFAEGAEDWSSFCVRVAAFLGDLCAGAEGARRVVVVTHSGVFDAVHEVLCGSSGRVEMDVAHTGVTWWRYRPGSPAGTWLLRVHNSTAHLAGAAG